MAVDRAASELEASTITGFGVLAMAALVIAAWKNRTHRCVFQVPVV
jgi:hypothetical protein